ncbi:MAG: SulP family inorganic anion transporter, partial [Aliarcobacter sp.]|nr:SulP family inorganic anion transporter [Aliarcobacter sp.]
GFTSGIAVVIATFQIKDFFGLSIENFNGSYIDKIILLFNSFHTFDTAELLTGSFTLFLLILWQKTKSKIPSALIALSFATAIVTFLNIYIPSINITTIASTFSYEIGELKGNGIPPIPLQFSLPWSYLNPIDINLDLLYKLLPHSIAIAILGALESLLCAVISDGMTGNKTDPNKELIGQGITNIIVPFFGGIPATAAIARTVVNIKSGATSKISSIIHALFILVSISFLASYLSFLPMASLSALLFVVAWNMSEVKHFVNIIKVAPKNDVYVLLVCFILTVLLDMQIAVAVGIGSASVLFIKRTIDLYSIELINTNHTMIHPDIPDNISIYDINGPMFFGAAQSALKTLLDTKENTTIVILNMQNVSMIDMTGIVALKSIVDNFKSRNKTLIFSGLSKRILTKLEKANFKFDETNLINFNNLEDSINYSKAVI